MKTRQNLGIGITGILFVLAVFIASYIVIPFFVRDFYSSSAPTEDKKVLGTEMVNVGAEPAVTHIPTPAKVKGIYMTSCVAGTPSLRTGLMKIADTTEVNTIVIDVKDFSGMLSFTPKDPALKDYVSDRCMAPDMEEFIKLLHSKNIYVIARVTVFQDPFYTKLRPDLAVKRASDGGVWKDRKGINYLDPGSKEVWDHIISIAQASYDIGFDEINFDYIRFPSDGNMKDIAFPFSGKKSKPEVLESFFSYLNTEMKKSGITTSADLFGMTTTNFDDLNIGQVLERTLPYFDYVCPMVYPSHYPSGFNGWKNPNLYPYELINFVMARGARRAVATSSPIKTLESVRIGTSTPAVYSKPVWSVQKLRPWLQDFNYGGTYGPEEVRAQIDATYDAGLTSWLMWSPSNRYTLGALHADE